MLIVASGKSYFSPEVEVEVQASFMPMELMEVSAQLHKSYNEVCAGAKASCGFL